MNEYLLAGIVRVCMCCNPGKTVFDTHPHLAGLGLEISHGLCQTHKAEYMAQMKKPAVVETTAGTH